MKGLQTLDLSDTRVTDSGLKELAGLMALVDLNLRGTLVAGPGVENPGRT